MAERIPLRQLPSDSFELTLAGSTYKFRNRWNDREQRWRLDIFEQNGTPIVLGLKLVPFVNLTERFADERLPTTGHLVVTDTEPITSIRPLAFEDLDDRLKLIFFTNEELDGIILP
jgi:hypothetical protein